MRLGLRTELLATDWRHGADAREIEARLAADSRHEIKAVCIVHNETSTGVVSSVPAVRAAIDAARHPALLLVDTISSLASIDFRMDEWGVDVTVAGSQKGLMLPPGLSLQRGLRESARGRAARASLPKSFWDWRDMLAANEIGLFPVHACDELALRSARGARRC